ncbi:MAG: hypothetical protein LM583_09445, partial [Desulfurococcaceae archaeon]|nr:hypothetical protein [Desulfurococcaceae archaeon]
KSQIKEIVKEIEVNKRVYNVVRSIVESSTSPRYVWNKPIMVSENMVKFVKYKVLPNGLEVKAWAITIQPLIIQKEGAELDADLIAVYDGLGNTVAKLIIRHNFLAYEDYKVYALKIMSKPDNIEIDAKSIHEFEFYAVKPSEETPYARPISLAALINKLMFYYSKALEVVRNVDADENEQL